MAKITWILVANSSKAKLFKSEKPFQEIELIEEYDHPQSREKAMNLVSDGYGRYYKGISPSGVYEEATGPKEVEAERFAHQLAEKLDKGRSTNQYHNLIWIVPSRFHGLLNKFCTTQVKNLVSHTLDKDYTKLKEQKLKQYLNGTLMLRRAA